jgi:hypothetical protein
MTVPTAENATENSGPFDFYKYFNQVGSKIINHENPRVILSISCWST